MELPERFRDDGDDDDAEEDVRPVNQGANMFMNMNQSIFGLIAAAGSNVDFSDRFEGQSSDEEDHIGETDGGPGGKSRRLPGMRSGAHTIVLPKRKDSNDPEKGDGKEDNHHRRSRSGNLLRSLPQLPKLASRSLRKSSKLRSTQPSESSGLSNVQDPEDDFPAATSPTEERSDARLAPVMSRMLEARAEMSSRPSFDLERLSGDFRRGDDGPSALACKLKDIFEFEKAEEVTQGATPQITTTWTSPLTCA